MRSLIKLFEDRDEAQAKIDAMVDVAIKAVEKVGEHPLGLFWQTITNIDIDGESVLIRAESAYRGNYDTESTELPLDLVEDPTPERIQAYKANQEADRARQEKQRQVSVEQAERRMYETLSKKFGQQV